MHTKLLIPENIIFSLIIFGFLFTFFTISFDVSTLGIPLFFGEILKILAIIANFIVAIVLIVDVFKNNVSGKYLWTLGFLIFAPIVGYFYVRNRKKYLL